MIVVESIVWGFVVADSGVAPSGDWEIVHGPGLSAGPVQFCRVRATRRDHPGTHEMCLLTMSTVANDVQNRAIVQRALLNEHAQAAVLPILAHREGYGEVDATPLVPDDVVAGVLAVSKVVGSWDESDPIVVKVGGTSFQVRTAHDGKAWYASVERCCSAP